MRFYYALTLCFFLAHKIFNYEKPVARQEDATDNQIVGAAASMNLSGAPDFPLQPHDVERIKAVELKVAKLGRKTLRKEVQHHQSQSIFHEVQKELADVHTAIGKRRLKKSSFNVRAKTEALRQAAADANSEEEEEDLGPTPACSSPIPEDVVDLTADEDEEDF